MYLKQNLRLMTLLVILCLTFLTVRAADLTDEQVVILNDLNVLRRAENRVPLVVSEQLDAVAERLLNDIVMRDLLNRGNTFELADGTTLEQMLIDAGYSSYNGLYEADVVSLILRDFTPPDAVNYWNQTYDEMAGLQTLQMQQGFLRDLPIFFDRFREVGIAYRFNQENERHYYVVVFAARPDVFPISITDLDSNDLLPATTERQVLVHVPNYVINRDLTNATLQGDIELVRISEEAAPQACPANASTAPHWETYRKNYAYTLSDGFGPKVVYVQVCDAQGNSLVVTGEIFFGDTASLVGEDNTTAARLDPVILNAVQATQTAAATATAYAEVLPTVEAILTATAAAPPATAQP